MGDYAFLLNNTLAGIHKVTVIQRRSYILKFFTQPVVVMVVTNKGVGEAHNPNHGKFVGGGTQCTQKAVF